MYIYIALLEHCITIVILFLTHYQSQLYNNFRKLYHTMCDKALRAACSQRPNDLEEWIREHYQNDFKIFSFLN